MTDYQKEYHIVFNAVTDALRAMEALNFGTAQEILRRAQMEAEEVYLTRTDDFPTGE